MKKKGEGSSSKLPGKMKRRFEKNVLLKNIFLPILVLAFVALTISLTAIYFQKEPDYIYAGFLKKRMLISCGSMISLGMLLVLFGAAVFRKKYSSLIESWMLISWFALSIMIAVYAEDEMRSHCADIENEDHVTATCEFEKDYTRDFVFLNDEKPTRLFNTNATFLDTGRYSGTIIYSQRSRYVLSYSLESGEHASVADDE